MLHSQSGKELCNILFELHIAKSQFKLYIHKEKIVLSVYTIIMDHY